MVWALRNFSLRHLFFTQPRSNTSKFGENWQTFEKMQFRSDKSIAEVLVQGTKADPEAVDSYIEEMLTHFSADLRTMKDEEFANRKESVPIITNCKKVGGIE